MTEWALLLFQVAMGIGLAACAGLRAFLPLFVLGAAGRLDWVALSPSFQWLSSTPALVVFGVAVVTEVLSDKVPVVDHVLDILGGVIKPIAGTVVAASVLTDLSPLQSTVVGLVAGGGAAGVVHLAKAKLRLFSSLTTGGLGNPVLSLAEDVASFVGSALAIVMPVLLLAAVAATFAILLYARRRFRQRFGALARRPVPAPSLRLREGRG
jgi:hypothetical protein